MTKFGKKMNQRRPRVRKAKKEASGRRERNPPQITSFWGRGASMYRPGLFTKRYFVEHGEACCADIYYALSRQIEDLNAERIVAGEKPLRRPNYSSYSRYFYWFVLLGLLERIDRREPAIYPFLRQRQFYTLTTLGRAEVRAWEDPVRFRHPKFV